MVAQDPAVIAHGDDLLSIREVPGESTGRSKPFIQAVCIFVFCASFSALHTHEKCRHQKT